jgi:hypothetical protein
MAQWMQRIKAILQFLQSRNATERNGQFFDKGPSILPLVAAVD